MQNEMLFDALPAFSTALPADELVVLKKLDGCEWPTNQEVDWADHAAARRLETRGLIRVSRCKDDPAAHYPTWYAGKLPSASIRSLPSAPTVGEGR